LTKANAKGTRGTWRFFGVCGICGWKTKAGTSWIITGNWVARHVSEEHPESEGLVGHFFRKRVFA
jgi:hypothetical protein